MISAYSVTDAFQRAYAEVNQWGEVVESRIGKTKHITDVTITVYFPRNNVCLDKARNLSLRYLLAELHWYLSGSNKVADIAPYAKMWNDLTDDGETLNSAYGYRIFHKFGFDQLQYCIDKLKKNPYDRQAVIHIKEASNTPTKDTPCTCLLQFTCFRNRLHLHTYMRSNDVWLGLPYDMAFFTTLLQIVSEEVGIPIGVYHHTVGDLHLYERHWDKPVRIGSVNNVDTSAKWLYTEEDFSTVVEKRQCPTNSLLKSLWRINNESQD